LYFANENIIVLTYSVLLILQIKKIVYANTITLQSSFSTKQF